MIAYAITDPSTLKFETLSSDIQRFSEKADMIVYRDKFSSNYETNAKFFLEETQKYDFQKVLLHSNYRLANELGADGVHLTATQFDEIEKAKALELFVIVSTHTLLEAKRAELLGADMVTFSPIFFTPNKGEPKGLSILEKVTSHLYIPIIALGGIISQEQIDDCAQYGAIGFASIRYFS